MKKKDYIKKYGMQKYNLYVEKVREQSSLRYHNNPKRRSDMTEAEREEYRKKGREQSKLYRVRHKEKELKRHKVYRETHREQTYNYLKKWRKENRNIVLGYNEKNNRKRKCYFQTYYHEHVRERKEYAQKYYEEHREKRLEQVKKYHNEHKCNENYRERRTMTSLRHKGKGFEPLTESLKVDFEWHHIAEDLPHVIAVPKDIHRSNLKREEHYSDINGKWLILAGNNPEIKLRMDEK